MARRTDGLPDPVTAGEVYLATLIDEVRGLRQELRAKAPENQPQVIITAGDPEVTHVKEQEPNPPVQGKQRGRR